MNLILFRSYFTVYEHSLYQVCPFDGKRSGSVRLIPPWVVLAKSKVLRRDMRDDF